MDGSFFHGGKADFGEAGECAKREVLALVNRPDLTIDDLPPSRYLVRSMRNLIAHRYGPDGIGNTEDDDYIDGYSNGVEYNDPLEELDAIPWIGPKSWAALVDSVTDLCLTGLYTAAYFSPSYQFGEDYVKRVVELIEATQVGDTIDIAMYSFSQTSVLNALEDAVLNRDVSVRFVFDKDHCPSRSMAEKLEQAGVDVRYVNIIMHNKFAIFNGPRDNVEGAHKAILVSGSGNWSSAVYQNDENMIEVQGSRELVLRFQKEFNRLWNNSRDFESDATFGYFESMEIVEEMIPDDPSVDAIFTSDNFRTYNNSRWGNTFSTIDGLDTISDRLVEYINDASGSIWISSGHLRSRPVAEALIAKHQSNPDMDIRVYLDGQEYVSYSTHQKEMRELNDCLEIAGDDAGAQQECLDKGIHWAYQVQDAGVQVRFKYYAYHWDYHYAPQMHHKYFIIDDKILITGSYNLSDNAEHNTIENMAVFHRPAFSDLIDRFKDNMSEIWETGKANGDKKYHDLMDLIENTNEPVPLVFSPMALTHDQIVELKYAIRTDCPDADSTEYRTDPVGHQTCYR